MDPLKIVPGHIEWEAYWDPEGPIGYGKTKAKALSDLIDQCDDADGHAQDMLAGAIVAALVRREEYDRANPLGGPASMFRAMAERIEAGEAYAAVLADYGVTVGAPPSDCGGLADKYEEAVHEWGEATRCAEQLTDERNTLMGLLDEAVGEIEGVEAEYGDRGDERLSVKIRAALSAIRRGPDPLHETESPTNCGGSAWLIWFEDASVPPEVFVGDGTTEAVARRRFAQLSDNWNAHLFRRVESNCSEGHARGPSEPREWECDCKTMNAPLHAFCVGCGGSRKACERPISPQPGGASK